ncbi:MAG: peptidase [Planctomycetota bacterium]
MGTIGLGQAGATTLQLTDGRLLTGDYGETSGVADDPQDGRASGGQVRVTPISVIDDGLRRTFVHKTAVAELVEGAGDTNVTIRVRHNVAAKTGPSLGSVGPATRVTPFDEYGRRICELPTNQGFVAVVQGVTRVTPVYTRVDGLRAKPKAYRWDTRLATNSLPRETLARVLRNAVPRDDFDQRMQVVRLYLQSQRYRDAAAELESVRADFADSDAIDPAEFDENLRRLRRLAAQALLDEIELRRDAGQFALTHALLERFPADGVTGETLQRVRELLDADDAAASERVELLARLDAVTESLVEPAAREVAVRLVAEVRERLTPASADRLAAFAQLARGDALSEQQLAAVALSGWLLGSNRALDELSVALSLLRARDDVVRYLAAPDEEARDEAFVSLRDNRAATVERVAELLRRIEPPLPLEERGDDSLAEDERDATPDAPPGEHELSVTVGERTVRSLVQLPAEYDPLRRYPAVVALVDQGQRAESMLDHWAGGVRGELGRVGQARRNGYVTLAVEWAPPGAAGYRYTASEHAAVLRSLRNAMRRVSIDADRVFLTGHGAGADAAWDIGLAHPDLWAGCLPYLGTADRYCQWYWRNARWTGWRITHGELDSDRLTRNASELDRYLRPRHDATVVEYRGRGYERLADDLPGAFDWMNRRTRPDPPEEFECSSLRPWDNFFWWAEVGPMPDRLQTLPAQWPPTRGVRAASLRGRRYKGNRIGVFTPSDRVTVWLSPELVDFSQPIEVEHNGRRMLPKGTIVRPDLRVLLEDARTRADRQRPYWARVESS